MTALLVEQSELPHFHFNEALLKPFENLLNMKTCDIDVKVNDLPILFYILIKLRLHVTGSNCCLFV